MSHALTADLTAWNRATGDLPWGVQRVFQDVLSLVKDGKATLAYGADYREGKPCLVNAVGQMLVTGGGQGIPMAHYGAVVGMFDRINRGLEPSRVNNRPGWVSGLAAEILLTHFGTLKDVPTDVPEVELPYVEPTDDEMAAALYRMEAAFDNADALKEFSAGYENVDSLYS